MTSVIPSKWYLRFKGLASRLKIAVHFLWPGVQGEAIYGQWGATLTRFLKEVYI
jgi:hypothetical protein